MRRRSTYLLLFAILAGAAALYLPTLRYEAIWDTRDFLKNSILLTQERPLADAFKSGYIYGQFGMDNQSMYYRPLVTLSFMLEKRLWGLSPATLRATNIFIFLSLLVTLFVLIRTWGGSHFAALAATALFAVSPINAGNVTWVVGRGDLMMLLWGTITLILLRKGKNRGIWVIPVAWISFTLAVLSKETALFFIPLFLLADPPGTKWRQRVHHFGFLGIGAAFLAVKHLLLGIGSLRILISPNLLDYPVRGLSVLGHYAGVLLLPFHPPLFNFITEVETPEHLIGGILVVLVAMVAAVWAFNSSQHEHLRMPTTMIVTFLAPFIALSLTAMWPFSLSTRYMMAASVGVFWLLARGIERLPGLPRYVILPAILLIFLPATIDHNTAHRDELTYWQRALEDHPANPVITLKLAGTLYRKKNDLEAYALLQRNQGMRVERLTFQNQRLLLAKLELERFDYTATLKHLETAEPLIPSNAFEAELLRSRIAAARGNPDEAYSRLQKLIHQAPRRSEPHVLLHRLLTGRRNWPAALEAEKAARLALGNRASWNTADMARRFKEMSSLEKVGFYLDHHNPLAAAALLKSLDLEDNLDNRLLSAWIDFQAGRDDLAKEKVRQAGAVFSEPADHARIARFFLDHMKQPETAITWYRLALTRQDNPQWKKRVAGLQALVHNDK
ncbi:MAG: hypothetical protein JXA62_08575 [Candidatus Aminicenantes bacterium]|nr:hypothetical protein [Candidatus Aminicenantes bacterium]